MSRDCRSLPLQQGGILWHGPSHSLNYCLAFISYTGQFGSWLSRIDNALEGILLPELVPLLLQNTSNVSFYTVCSVTVIILRHI
jgi:hypothetical protein